MCFQYLPKAEKSQALATPRDAHFFRRHAPLAPLPRLAPETATNVRPLTPMGAGVESFPRTLPQSLCHSRNAATGRDKSLTLQRPQARPARSLPRGGTDTRAVRFNEARLEETGSPRLVVDGGKWHDSRNERRGGGDELVINPLLLAVAAWSSMGNR
jgi:hypothetical protein